MPSGTSYQANDHDQVTLDRGLFLGVSLSRIAERLGVAVPTLQKHYGDVIKAAGLKRGPKRFRPSDSQRRMIYSAAVVGVPHEEMAEWLGISKGTLQTHFYEELKGRIVANLRVGGKLFEAATGDPARLTTVKAAIWWTKGRMGWGRRNPSASAEHGEASDKSDVQVVVYLPDNARGDAAGPAVPDPRSEAPTALSLIEIHPDVPNASRDWGKSG